MQFQVPQFIEIEDKIIGPFTFFQFMYLLGGFGGGYALYRLLEPYLGSLVYVVVVPLIIFSLALAFYKVNERPFINIVESWIKFKFSGKRYLWKKEEIVIKKQADDIDILIRNAGTQKAVVPKLTSGRLKDIAWSLDIQEKIK
ncbi:MAG: PrgI family protein [bacterium]